jgi:hypothetical protein
MGIINLLENEYELYGVRWKEEPHILKTDSGDKRLRYWSDENLLNWHVNWRDESAAGSGAVTDRMIRTRDGEVAVYDGRQWVTVHDCADEWFGCEEVDRWGQLIGELLKNAVKPDSDQFIAEIIPEVNMEACFSKLRLYSEGNFQCIHVSMNEAEKRFQYAEALRKRTSACHAPILEKELKITRGKRIFHFLFYEGGNSKPVKGYLPIRNFLLDWLSQTSPLSLKMLLSNIHSIFPLDTDHGLQLLAEISMPRELEECVNFLDNSTLEKMVEGMDRFEKHWEENRTLLKTVTEWFEDNRRKVAL